jgi:hypothetical protein
MILNEQVAAYRAGSPGFPQALLASFGGDVPSEFWAAGVIAHLDQRTGFFCSSRCSGSVVLKTFDAITRMRDEGQILIGGFHSVMEWEPEQSSAPDFEMRRFACNSPGVNH